MKKDYLWDKTGEDPEIKRLEDALKMFRYQETAPPALPAKIPPFAEKAPRQFFRFRFAFAFAAGAAVVLILFGVWFQTLSGKIAVVNESAETTAPPIKNAEQDDLLVNKPDILPIKKIEAAQQIDKPNIVKIRQSVPVNFRRNKTIAKNTEIKKPTVALTKAEKYAYDQLMLALSITSSKLKIVKDKIDGIEEQNAVLKDGR